MRVFKRLPTAIAALGLLAISSGVVRAQGGIAKGYSDVAGVLGIGGIGEASIALGGRYEKIIKTLSEMNKGLPGIRAGVDWYTFSVVG